MIQSLASAQPAARYVLDVEATIVGPMPVGVPLEGRLQALRDLKNRVFFSLLSDEALRPYDTQDANPAH